MGKPNIIVLMGTSGAGKTTVGKRLAADLGWTFLEGDALHPASNIKKMRAGIPLTDADRAPWLDRLRGQIERYLATGQSAVVACSALRRAYRERLRVDPQRVRFVYLKGDYELLRERLQRRKDHYMKVTMLKSQLAAFEEPRNAFVVDAALPVETIVAQVRLALGYDRGRAPSAGTGTRNSD